MAYCRREHGLISVWAMSARDIHLVGNRAKDSCTLSKLRAGPTYSIVILRRVSPGEFDLACINLMSRLGRN